MIDKKINSDSMLKIVLRRFTKHRMAMASCWMLLILILGSIFIPIIMYQLHGYRPDRIVDKRYDNTSPEWKHPLGTDDQGNDLITRLAYGGRISLGVGFLAAITAALFGTVFGAIAGYFGRLVDSAMMRFVDVMLSLPVLPLMLIAASIDLNKIGLGSIQNSVAGEMLRIIFIAVAFGWMGTSRLVRGEILSLKERDFVEAARAQGASHSRIIFVHLIPNSMAPIIVSATLAMGSTILYESALSFLGLGITPPIPSWGNMLTDAQSYFRDNFMLAVYPGMLILTAVVCFNFIGDGLRDALDPKQFMKSK